MQVSLVRATNLGIWKVNSPKFLHFLSHLLFHNGLSRTEKIFKKVELRVSMDRLTPNLVNASQKKWKKVKKNLENDGIWTTDFH